MTAINGAEQPPSIPPSPLPTMWAVATVDMSDGERKVLVQIQTPQGSTVLFFDPKSAMQFGAALASNGRGASSGLILPPGGLN